METTTGNPIIQRLQCTAAIHVILVLPTLNVHFVSETTQVQNATLQATPLREKLYYDPNRCFKCNSNHHISICDVYGLNSRHGITQGPENRIGNISQNRSNNNSTLSMTNSANAESADNLENSHTMLSINKGDNALLQTARGIIINKENQNLIRNSTHCNNRNGLLLLSFTLKISIF